MLKRIFFVLLMAFAFVACDDTEEGDDALLTVEGGVLGGSEDTKIAIIWIVSSGSPDYEYKFGEAAWVEGGFTLKLDAEPPAEAINSYGVGVAMIALMDANVEIPDGIVSELPDPLGFSPRQAIIWRAPNAENDWIESFPEGYSCGVCIDANGDSFDSYSPTSCTAIQVHSNDSMGDLEICNWT